MSNAVLHDCGHAKARARLGNFGVYYSCDKDDDRMFNEQEAIYAQGYYFVTREEFYKGQVPNEV